MMPGSSTVYGAGMFQPTMPALYVAAIGVTLRTITGDYS